MHARTPEAGKRKRGRKAGPPAIGLRNAEPRDDATLLILWHELMDLHVELDDRFALSEDADAAFLAYAEAARTRDDYRLRVAELDGELVGFAVSCLLPNSPVYRAKWIGYINDISVTASKRGLGIGEALVDDAIWWLKRNGAESIEVYVARANEGAQRFWRRVGGRDYLDRLSIDLSGRE